MGMREVSVIDIAKRRRAGKIPEWRVEDFQAVVYKNADAMVVLDREGYILYANPASESLFNLPSAELVGASLGFPLILDEPVELQILREYKDFITVEMRMVEVVWAGEPSYLLSFRDMTDRIPAEQAISQSWEKLESMVDERTRELSEANERLEHEIARRKRVEEALKVSEKQLKSRLNAILSPGDIGVDTISDIMDIPALQDMADSFYSMTGVGISINDLHGTILVGAGWQDICTKFHRCHPETIKNCVECDLHLSGKVAEGEYRLYKCKNGMWDIVTPIIVNGKHLANLFSGQFFFDDEVPDRDYFERQAAKYGFNKEDYLAAMDRVPRHSRDKIREVMGFYTKFARMVSQLSYSNVQMARSLVEQKRAEEELKKHRDKLHELIQERTHELETANDHLRKENEERKSVEKALWESEGKYRDLVENVNDIVWQMDEKFVFTYISPQIFNAWGYTPEEVVGKTSMDFMPPDEAERVSKAIENVAGKKKKLLMYENRHLRKDGRIMYLEVSGQPIIDENGIYRGYRGVARDITKRKQIEEDKKRLIHELEERVKELGALHRVYGIIQKGRSVPEVLQEITNILPPAWQYPEITTARITIDGQEFTTSNFLETPWKQRADFHTADGKHVAIEVYYLEEMRDEVEGPFLAEERDLINSLAEMVRIYLDKWYAEKNLTDAKAQVELYIDLMGHDINNLNQIALGYLELAVDMVKDNEVKELVKKPFDAIQNSSKLIENVRKLQKMRTGELKIEAIDVGGLLAELRNQYLNVPGKDVAIDYEPGRDCYVMANGLLWDVFSNLVGNAIKHSGPSKSVRIGLGLDRVKEDGREYCRVIVEDDGPGIPDMQKDMVFARFRKENAKAGGKGLGLYLVISLVDDFHGNVHVEDRVQGDYTKGARFVVMLPAVDK